VGKKNKYFSELYRAAKKDTVKQLGTKGAFMILALKIITTCIGAGLFAALGILDKNTAVFDTVFALFVADIIGFAGLWIVTPIVSIIKIPKEAILRDQKKDEKIKRLRAERRVRKPIILYAEPSPLIEEKEVRNKSYWRSLSVKNKTSLDVTDCMLRLMKVENIETGQSLIRRPEDLTWSNREKESAGDKTKTIPGKLSKICDLVKWTRKIEQGELVKLAEFTLAFGQIQYIPIGDYKCEIRIVGKYQERTIKYTQDVFLRYKGNEILLDDEWMNNA
jgi:hypothetical protein